MTCGQGVPLALHLSGANEHDGRHLLPLLRRYPAVRGRPGRPRTRPCTVVADKASHSAMREAEVRSRGVEPLLPQRGLRDALRLGRWRWVVERTVAWLRQFRRPRVRYEQREALHLSFLSLACVLICHRKLP